MHPECVPIPACLVLVVAQVLGVGPQLCKTQLGGALEAVRR